MIKKLGLSLVAAAAFASASVSYAAADFFGNAFVVLDINGGGNTFYDLNPTTSTLNPDFGGANLGTFDITMGNSLILNGAEFRTFEDGGDDVTSVSLNYRIYSGAAPGFTGFSIDFVNQTGNDSFWQTTNENINALSGLTPGVYTFEVFGSAATTAGARFYSNGGNNYIASFTVVPEPSSLALLAGPALLGGLFYMRRRRKS